MSVVLVNLPNIKSNSMSSPKSMMRTSSQQKLISRPDFSQSTQEFFSFVSFESLMKAAMFNKTPVKDMSTVPKKVAPIQIKSLNQIRPVSGAGGHERTTSLQFHSPKFSNKAPTPRTHRKWPRIGILKSAENSRFSRSNRSALDSQERPSSVKTVVFKMSNTILHKKNAESVSY